MKNEIERRWLVENPPADILDRFVNHIEQGYLPNGLRTRKTTMHSGDGRTMVFCHLTLKRARTAMTNDEIETEVPVEIHDILAAEATRRLTKKRRIIPVPTMGDTDQRIELDEFEDGTFIAEIELQNEDDFVDIPDWFGREITGDKTLTNYALAKPVDQA